MLRAYFYLSTFLNVGLLMEYVYIVISLILDKYRSEHFFLHFYTPTAFEACSS